MLGLPRCLVVFLVGLPFGGRDHGQDHADEASDQTQLECIVGTVLEPQHPAEGPSHDEAQHACNDREPTGVVSALRLRLPSPVDPFLTHAHPL